jgi:hypothetical protein
MKIPSYGKRCRVAPVRTDVSEERIATIIRMKRTRELVTTLLETSNRRTIQRNLLVIANLVRTPPIVVILMMEAIRSCKRPVLTRATQRNVSKDSILRSHRRETLNLT